MARVGRAQLFRVRSASKEDCQASCRLAVLTVLSDADGTDLFATGGLIALSREGGLYFHREMVV